MKTMAGIFKDSAIVLIFEFLAMNKGSYTVTEISKETKISRPTVYKVLLHLHKLRMLNKRRYQTVNKAYSYKYYFNPINKYSKTLLKIMKLLKS